MSVEKDLYKWHDVNVELPKKSGQYLCVIRMLYVNGYVYRHIVINFNFENGKFETYNTIIFEICLWTGIRPHHLS